MDDMFSEFGMTMFIGIFFALILRTFIAISNAVCW